MNLFLSESQAGTSSLHLPGQFKKVQHNQGIWDSVGGWSQMSTNNQSSDLGQVT